MQYSSLRSDIAKLSQPLQASCSRICYNLSRYGYVTVDIYSIGSRLQVYVRDFLLYVDLLDPFGSARSQGKNVQDKDNIACLPALHLDLKRHASHAPAPAGLFRTLLHLRSQSRKHRDRSVQLQIHCDHHRVFVELCSLFCRNLQRRHPVNVQRPV